MGFTIPQAIGTLPVFPVEFDKHRRLVEPVQVDRLRTHLTEERTTDLLVVAHGWNNDKAQALELYEPLLTNLQAQAGDALDGRRLAVLAVFWPSKRFADEDLIPGGAANLAGDVESQALVAQLAELEGFFDPDDADELLVELAALVPRLVADRDAQERFGVAVRQLLGIELPAQASSAAPPAADGRAAGLATGTEPTAADPDEHADDDTWHPGGWAPTGDPEVDDELPAPFLRLDGAELLGRLAGPRAEELAAIGGGPGAPTGGAAVGGGPGAPTGGVAAGGGPAGGVAGVPSGSLAATGGTATGTGVAGPGAAGGAAFLGSAFRGVRSGARNAVNLVTYYTMKRRAGEVGREGLAPVLRQLRDAAPALRLHLIGHSFGGRLVAAAALGERDDEPVLPVDSMVLLQAAFSHHGFAEDHVPGEHGYFRRVLDDGRLAGPLVITHTRNDRATTWAYPMASRLARQVAAQFGGIDDRYGAIGTNGALATPGAVAGRLEARSRGDAFAAGGIHNLEASDHVSGHSDVTNDAVASVVAAVIAGTPR